MPSLKFKVEYLKNIYERYHKANKEEKGRILQEFCKVCHYHRKHAIRRLNEPLEKENKVRGKGASHYSPSCIQILQSIWEATGYLCSQRLKAALPLWLPHARKRFKISPETERQLLSISPRQMDRRLRNRKIQLKKRVYHTTRPGKLLKSMIPIRTHLGDIRLPGFLGLDTVAHCGNSNAGDFIFTLDATDIFTGWTERVAVLGKGQEGIIQALRQIQRALPCQLRGIHSDNGEEFINYHVLEFCKRFNPKIQFTRGRPNKKNDNAHVEQKNWTHVRQIFGWDRYQTLEASQAMNDLYANDLRLFQNLFQPSLKLAEKLRVGSKVVRHYDPPKTPLQRLLESKKFHKAKVKQLRRLSETLDPFELSAQIDAKLQKIFLLACKTQSIFKMPRVNQGIIKSPWRYWRFSKKQIRRHKKLAKLQEQSFKYAA